MIFGSEKFEPLLGELQLASMMNLEEGQPHELLAHRQKKREIQIALNLIETLKPFMNDDIEDFQDQNSKFAEELATNNMGKLMLGKIASIYREQSNQRLGGLKSTKANLSEIGHKWKQKKAVAKSMWSTYK